MKIICTNTHACARQYGHNIMMAGNNDISARVHIHRTQYRYILCVLPGRPSPPSCIIFLYFYIIISFFFFLFIYVVLHGARVFRAGIPIPTRSVQAAVTAFSKSRTLRPHRRRGRHPVYRHDNTDRIVYTALPVFTGLTDFNFDLLVVFFFALYIL